MQAEHYESLKLWGPAHSRHHPLGLGRGDKARVGPRYPGRARQLGDVPWHQSPPNRVPQGRPKDRARLGH